MKRLAFAAFLVACTPAPVRTEVTLRPVAPTAPQQIVVPAPQWEERAYHLEQGLWELSGKLHEGHGTFAIAYHDGSTQQVPMMLDGTMTYELRDHRSIRVIHIVSEKPSGAMGRKWYAIYTTATPPKLLGGIMTDEELGYERGNVFLASRTECRRYIAITSTRVEVDERATCPDTDEVDY